MNCRPGDLAVVVRANVRENIGRYVTVVATYAAHHPLGHVWSIEPNGPMPSAGLLSGNPREGPPKACPDAWLRPIRDQPGEDEMIRIAGKPVETVHPQISEEEMS